MKYWLLCLIIPFCLTSAKAQTQLLSETTYYKNVTLYTKQANNFIAQRRYLEAEKKLKYAHQFVEKLVKQGYGKEIQHLIQRIQLLEGQLPKEVKATVHSKSERTENPAALSRTAFQEEVKSLSEKQAQISRLFSFFPHLSEIKAYHQQYVAAFQSMDILTQIARLKKQPQAQEPYHKSQLRQLDKIEMLAKDLESAMQNSPIDRNLEATYRHLKTGSRTPDEQVFVLKQVDAYLGLLDQLQPNSTFVEAKIKKANTFKNTLLQDQKAAAQTAAEEKARQSAVATKNAKQIPTAQTKDPALEKEFSALVKPHLPSNSQLMKLIITSSRWGIQKDALGRALERSRIAIALYKNAQGQCFQRSFIFAQETANNGVSWTPTKLDLDWSGKTGRPSNCQ